MIGSHGLVTIFVFKNFVLICIHLVLASVIYEGKYVTFFWVQIQDNTVTLHYLYHNGAIGTMDWGWLGITFTYVLKNLI